MVLFSVYPGFFPQKQKTDSGRYAGTTLYDSETHINKASQFLVVVFFYRAMVSGCQETRCGNIYPVIWLAELSMHRLDP